MLDKDALVDGLLKINVFDEDNNIVAEGYHAGNNISINDSHKIDMSYGFENGLVCVYCKPLDYEIIDNTIKLNFNNLILSDITANVILEEVMYSIGLSLCDELDVEEVIFQVNNEEISTFSQKGID